MNSNLNMIDEQKEKPMVIKFIPIPIKKVWGGKNLIETYQTDETNIGEVWGISAHKSYSNIIDNGEFCGISFRELYKLKKELFGYYDAEEFPVLIKVIDAAEDLSVQVHPQDKYALIHEDSYGKDECWYILKTQKEDTEIIIGHKAKTKEELTELVMSKSYDKLLNRFKIKPEDYFYIPSGKVHAICQDTTLLEVSQSSDITYRLYDYERLDNGKLRELHIKQSLDVINVPDTPLETVHNDKFFDFKIMDNFELTEYHSHPHGDYIYVISGKGCFGDVKVDTGDFLMVSAGEKYKINGKVKYALINLKIK